MRAFIPAFLLACPSWAGVSFTEVDAGLADLRSGAAAWGDYDNDGELDLVICGRTNDPVSVEAHLYRHVGADTFSEVPVGLTGVYNTAFVAWADYDGDRDLDLALAGYTGSGNVTTVYENDAGALTPAASLDGVDYCSLAWGDYDNDGDPDLALVGMFQLGDYRTRIYNNASGTFSDSGIGLRDITHRMVTWGDYDNDADLDLLVSGGDASSAAVTLMYENDGTGALTEKDLGLLGVFRNCAAWGDFDGDGDLDLAITGYWFDGTPQWDSKVYRNNGGSFSDSGASIIKVESGWLAWGDYDNDGDLDLIVCGRKEGVACETVLYRNNGGSLVDSGLAFPGLEYGMVAWGDYDGDGDLDLIFCGSDGTPASFTRIYRSDGAPPNTPPQDPAGLNALVNGSDVTLSWAIASDAESPSAALTYNVRVGTLPGACDVMPSISDAATGRRLIPAMGNVQQNLSWTLRGLPDGNYYWSVQAVDTAFSGSAWAAEEVFTVGDSEPPTVVSTSPGDGGTDVAPWTEMRVTFSEPMNTGATEGAFSISPATTGSFSWDGSTLVFTPSAALAKETVYAATVSTAARDLAGNALALACEFSFTIGDYTAPGDVASFAASALSDWQVGLSWANPTDADFAGVAVFRKEGSTPGFTPTRGASYTVGQTYGDAVCVFVGSAESFTDTGLSASTPYYYAAFAYDEVPNYSTGVSDGATTSAPQPPEVVSTVPADDERNVPVETVVRIEFSKPMDTGTIEGAFSISPAVAGSFSWPEENVVVFSPQKLKAGRRYTVTVATDARDKSGLALASAHSFSFTTRLGEGVLGGGGCLPAGGALTGGSCTVALCVLLLLFRRRRTSPSRWPSDSI